MPNNNLFTELAKEFISGDHEVADIITFIESPWGLSIKLLPVQRFILRCVSGDTLITNDNGVPVSMRSYYESKNRFVNTYDKSDGKIKMVAHNGCVANGRKEVFQITTKLTRRVAELTSEHRVLTPNGYIPVGALKKGDWVVVSERESRPLSVSGVTMDEAAILGFMLGDGSCAKANIGLVVCNGHDAVHAEFERACLSVMPDAVFRRVEARGAYVLYVARKKGWDRNTKSAIGCLLDYHGLLGKTCHNKRIPNDMFNARDDVIRHFLRCLFATDGGMCYSDKGAGATRVVTLNYTSCNKMLIDDVGFLLRRFGVRATVVHCSGEQMRKYKGAFPGTTGIWQVRINSVQEIIRFIERIGIPVGWDTRYANVWRTIRERRNRSFCHTDRLPENLIQTAQDSRRVFFSVGGKIKRSDSGTIRAPITGKKALKVFAEFIGDDNLQREASSDICWDRVWNIKSVGEKDVYDVSVPVTNNFIVNGIVVHNCLYGLPLGSGERNIEVPDVINERVLYKFNEKEFLSWLYAEGRCNTEITEGHVYQELVLAAGRRASKSTLAACISNYELYKLVRRGDPSSFYGFPSFTQMVVLNVAPTDEQSGQVFDMTQTMALRCPYMKSRSLHQTMTYFDLQTDADMKIHGKPKASLISLAGGCSSNALRGRNAIVVIMDEMAHFIDNAGRFSGSEVYKALTPSIASFRRDGKVVCISSPYAKYGAFYDRYVQSHQEQDITLMFKMYSAMVNPTIPTEILAAARRRDRTGFMCEYGGEFSDSVTAWIDDEPEFRRCLITTPGPVHGEHDTSYYYGLDLGFKIDGTAIAVVHKNSEGKIVLDYADVWYSGSSDVWESPSGLYTKCRKYASQELLRMSDIVAEIKELAKWFPLKEGLFDQHNGYALAELLTSEGFKQFKMENFSDTLISDVYQLAKRLYAEQLLLLYEHPILVQEILTLEAEKRAGQKVIVRKPNRAGAHDDISDAFVRAVWLCYNNAKDNPFRVALGTGSSVSSVGGKNLPGAIKQETQAEFVIRRLKTHGAHPRGLYNLRGLRRNASVR